MNSGDANPDAIQRFIYRWRYFLFALLAYMVAGRFFGHQSLALIACIFVIVGFSLPALRFVGWYRRVFSDHQPMTDISDNPPKELAALPSQIKSLGFIHSGYTRGDDITLASFANSDGTIYGFATVTNWTFSTRFADGSYVVTGTPFGENVQVQNYSATRSSDTVNALSLHRKTSAAWQVSHGAIVPTLSIHDIIQADHLWDKSYKRTHFRRQLRLAQAMIALYPIVIFLAIGCAVLQLAYPKLDPFYIVLLLGIVVLAFMYARRFLRGKWDAAPTATVQKT